MTRHLRVLIVDDSKDDALLIVDELEDNGYNLEYKRIENSAQMAEALADQVWDVVVADYTMPDFSGPEALLLLQRTGQDIPLILVSGTAPDQNGIEMMRSGAKDFILKSNLSRLAAAVERELTEAEVRRQRAEAERALREAEHQKLEFYRRTILAATDGKLVICEKEQIDDIAGAALASWEVRTKEQLSHMRDDVKRIAIEQGMNEDRVPLLLACVVEAGANAVKHADGGRASLHRTPYGLMFAVSDSGLGIGALSLPDVALTKGYSTAGTLGMGYKIMLDSAEKVYLATGPDGTTVAFDLALDDSTSGPEALLDKLSGWLEE